VVEFHSLLGVAIDGNFFLKKRDELKIESKKEMKWKERKVQALGEGNYFVDLENLDFDFEEEDDLAYWC